MLMPMLMPMTTLKPGVSSAFRVRVSRRGLRQFLFLHHLALIADNRRDELKGTLGIRGRYYMVSHLCHDNNCFNPRHLHVESTSDNQKRRTCKGKTIIVRDGIRTHPCVHSGDENKYKCILPEEWMQDTAPKGDEQVSTTGTPTPDESTLVTDIADKFSRITPTMAEELINRYHVITTELGCWESSLKPLTHGGGSCELNLAKLNARIRLHQLALIADNRVAEMQRGFDVSHLCNNAKCFNFVHLVAESRKQNLKRKTCVGHKVIVTTPLFPGVD
ncbi:zinc-binding loop region of homing endonuclease-domain-containing protein [Lipomyces tetrasporus]